MNNNPVIVLGLGPAGLFLVRQLSHVTSAIYAVGRPDDVGMYSKHIPRSNRFYAVTADELQKTFAVIKDKAGQVPLLYICSDQYLSILIERKELWNGLVQLAGSDLEMLAMINDKNTINDYCEKHGVRIPQTFSYTGFKNSKTYPVIVKWVEKRIETAVNPIGKIKVCRSDAEFEAVDKVIGEGSIREDELFVQTYVEGQNNSQFSVGGFYKDGMPLAEVVVNQIKQQPQGISAEVITASDPVCGELIEISHSFTKVLGYSGFLEMEFKVDEVSRQVFLLDVNPLPISIAYWKATDPKTKSILLFGRVRCVFGWVKRISRTPIRQGTSGALQRLTILRIKTIRSPPPLFSLWRSRKC